MKAPYLYNLRNAPKKNHWATNIFKAQNSFKIHFDHVKSQQLSLTLAAKRCMLKQSKSAETWQTLKIAATQPRNANLVSRQVIPHKDLGHAVKY